MNTLVAGQAEPRWQAFVRQYRDPMQLVLLDVRQWLIRTAVALSIVAAAEIRKAVRRRTAKSQRWATGGPV